MSEMVINGVTLEIGDCKTVLEVARCNEIEIPTLCHHPSLEAYGACRLCVVEVVAGGRPGLAASCVLPATEGLKVETSSQRVVKAREMIVQLLLGICPEAEVLQKLAAQMGIDHKVFPVQNDKNCVLCGLCVRTCKTMGNGALGFAFRGSERKVGVPFDEQAKECLGCLACVNVCPVKTIKTEESGGKLIIQNWFAELDLQKCAKCGRYFAPERYVAKLSEKYPDKEFRVDLCDHCKMEESASKIVRLP